jgi:hypothetical protein
VYSFTFGSINQTASGGTVAVTTRTPDTKCAINGWSTNSAGTTVTIGCNATTTALGNPKDANVSVYFGRRPIMAVGGWGFAWADQPTNTMSYRPASFYQGMSSGQAVSVWRLGTGGYEVFVPALATPDDNTFMLVFPYGSNPDTTCNN